MSGASAQHRHACCLNAVTGRWPPRRQFVLIPGFTVQYCEAWQTKTLQPGQDPQTLRHHRENSATSTAMSGFARNLLCFAPQGTVLYTANMCNTYSAMCPNVLPMRAMPCALPTASCAFMIQSWMGLTDRRNLNQTPRVTHSKNRA